MYCIHDATVFSAHRPGETPSPAYGFGLKVCLIEESFLMKNNIIWVRVRRHFRFEAK